MTAGAPGQGRVVTLPRSVFEAPLFRGLDARAHREIEAAATIRPLARDETLYRDGDRGEALLVVLAGEVELRRERESDGGRAGVVWSVGGCRLVGRRVSVSRPVSVI